MEANDIFVRCICEYAYEAVLARVCRVFTGHFGQAQEDLIAILTMTVNVLLLC